MKAFRIMFATILTVFMIASLAHAVQIGPAPTSAALNKDGPFSVSSTSVSSLSARGFGSGTIYYPTTAGQYGVIAVCPGFTGTSSSISWFARRLATHGFVTIAMNTTTTLDQPDSRATQLAAALKCVLSNSTVKSRIRSTDRGVAGHSMGGGGTLIASQSDSSLRVGIPMTPWNLSTNFSAVKVPQMIFGADGDTIAPYASHARPFYNSINKTQKAYGLLKSATHFTPNSTDQRIGRYGVAFAKRFVDGDTRYSAFLCGSEHSSYATSSKFATYLSNCPY
mgnify:FL=1